MHKQEQKKNRNVWQRCSDWGLQNQKKTIHIYNMAQYCNYIRICCQSASQERCSLSMYICTYVFMENEYLYFKILFQTIFVIVLHSGKLFSGKTHVVFHFFHF